MRFFLVVLVGCAALPAGAEAAVVSRTGGTLHYEAAKGERIVATLGETSGGAFVVRRANSPHQRLRPGAGCKRLPPRAVRCAGQGVVRVELSFKWARTSSVTVSDVRAAVAVRGAAAVSSILVRATPEFT